MLFKWKFFLKYLNKYKISLITFIVSFTIIEVVCYSYFGNLIYSKIINNINTLTLKDAIVLIIFYSAILPIYNIFFPIVSKIEFNKSIKAKKDIEMGLFKEVIKHNINYFNNNLGGGLSSKINSVSREIIYLFPIDNFNVIILFIYSLFMFYKINVYIVIFSVIWIISFFYIATKLFSVLSKQSQKISEEDSKLNGIIIDCFLNIGNIKAFSSEATELRYLKKQSNNILRNELAKIKSINKLQIILICFTVMFIFVCYLFFYYEYTKQKISLGTFIFLVEFTSQLAIWLRFSARGFQQMMQKIGTINNGLETLLKKPEIVDRKDSIDLQNITGKIEFKNINFSHYKKEINNEK